MEPATRLGTNLARPRQGQQHGANNDRNVHPKIVQERLGHENISVTLDTYSHVLPGMQEDALRGLGDILRD